MIIWRYKMKPIIGIVSRPQLRDNGIKVDVINNMSRRAIIKNGGIPMGILPTQDINYYDIEGKDMPKLTDEEKEDIINQINKCDGILLQGGTRWYEYDEFITNYIIENDIPSLFICMSMQLLNSMNYKNNGINYTLEKIGGHRSDEDYVHDINIKEDSFLYKILGKNKIKVNSLHSYAVVDSDLNVIATSSEGIIEGVDMMNKRFIVGLQWHPEKMIDFDEDANKVFKYFINKCKK